jgi:hypothetical protein
MQIAFFVRPTCTRKVILTPMRFRKTPFGKMGLSIAADAVGSAAGWLCSGDNAKP